MPAPTRAERIAERLRSETAASHLEVADQSALHAGHAGASPAGETHFDVLVVSDRFAGMSRVARSRLVHDLLAPEFGSGLHALSLRLLTPAESRPDPARPRA